MTEPTGPDTMLVFQIAGHEVIARVHAQDGVPARSPVSFEIDVARAHLFDAGTGRRI